MLEGLVSVIVAAYNEEAFIAEALDSAFAQDYRPIEVIVVDDGSTDATAETASHYDVRLLRQPNRGPAAARNAALAVARGEYIAALDADDTWPPDRLSSQVRALVQSPEAGLALGLSEIFATPGEPVADHYPHGVQNPAHGHMAAMLVRRSTFDVVGGYDERLRLSEDVEWYMRARDAGVTMTTIDAIALRYRVHARNTSRDKASNRLAALRIFRESLARRRAEAK